MTLRAVVSDLIRSVYSELEVEFERHRVGSEIRPFATEGLLARFRPFAIVAIFATTAVALLPPESELLFVAIGAAFIAGAIAVALAIARLHLAPWADVLPPLAFIVAFVALRQAGGGYQAGLVPLLALPIVWVALYGTGSQTLIIISASILAVSVPLLAIGAPAYPPAGWRDAIVDSAVGLLVITTVHALVARIRAQSRVDVARATQLDEQRGALDAILGSASDAIVTLTPSGEIEAANPAAMAMFRGGADQLVGLDLITTLVSAADRDRIRAGLVRLAPGRDPAATRSFRTELVRLDGDTFPADVSVGVVIIGDSFRVHAFARDVTATAQAEELTRRHLDDLQALLTVASEISDPARAPELRQAICLTAMSITNAAACLLLEPRGRDLIVAGVAGTGPAKGHVISGDEVSLSSMAFVSGEPIFAGALATETRIPLERRTSPGFGSGYWLPLRKEGGVAGVLAVFWKAELDALDPRAETLLGLLGGQAEVALEMTSLVGRLAGLARTDGLTGIANRRTFDETLVAEVARATRSGLPLSLIMLDLDHFKDFNDTRGHPAGDRLLVDVAVAWGRELRPTDVLARYGGEEFVVVLPDCPPEAALRIANRLRAAVPGEMTVSAGIANFAVNESAQAMMERADVALYRAKAGGRDRAVAA